MSRDVAPLLPEQAPKQPVGVAMLCPITLEDGEKEEEKIKAIWVSMLSPFPLTKQN